MDHNGRPPAKFISLAELSDYDNARKIVCDRARELVHRVRDAFPTWNPPPYNPKVYAKYLGIPVHKSERLSDWDALLVPASDGLHVLYNASIHSEGRKRFSIAHEIIHTFFEDAEIGWHRRTTDQDYYSTPESLALERLCDAGAAELLMPFDDFRRAAAKLELRVISIQKLAKMFRVSLQAAALRFVTVHEEPLAVGLFHRAAKPSIERVVESQAGRQTDGLYPIPSSLQRYRVLKMFRSHGFPFILPVGKSTPRGSIIAKAAVGSGEMEGFERYALGDQVYPLHITASPLKPDWRGDRPPTVCAVFRLP